MIGQLLALLIVMSASGTGVSPGSTTFDIIGTHAAGTHHEPVASGGSGTQDVGVHYTSHYIPCSGDACAPGFMCPPGQQSALENLILPGGIQNGSPTPVCLGPKNALTAAVIARAFRHIAVPIPALHIQPVKGRTLVNFRTNFYATGGNAFTRTVRLLGHRVTLRIHVDSYVFRFGDGGVLRTVDAGASYPELTNTHEYLRQGIVHPGLTTVWGADYRADGGRWRAVDGTVTVLAPRQRLQVVTATPVLTDPYAP